MARFISLLLFLALLSIAQAVHGQSQEFVDDATTAFKEVRVLREKVARLEEEGKAKDELINALTGQTEALQILVAEKNNEIVAKDRLITQLEARDATRLKEIQALRALTATKKVYLFGLYKKIEYK